MIYKKGTFAVIPVQQIMGVDPLAQVVYMWICFHTNQDGNCFPSQKLLSSETGLSITALKSKLKVLEGLNLLVRTKRNRENGGKSADFYQILLNEDKDKTENLHPPSPDAYTPPSPDAYHITILNKEHNTVANATRSIKMSDNEIYSMEELEYILEDAPRKKTKYGNRTIGVLVAVYLKASKIEVGERYNAARWLKPFSSMYHTFGEDVDKTVEYIKKAVAYFESINRSHTPYTLEADLPFIDSWIKAKQQTTGFEQTNRRKL